MKYEILKFSKYYYYLIIVLVFLPIFIVTNNYIRDSLKESYLFLDSSYMSSTIIKLNYYKMGTILILKDEKEYKFRDQSVYVKQIPKDKWLYDIADRGDSIYKAAYSDTLFLFKQNGENYFFVFDRSDLYWD